MQQEGGDLQVQPENGSGSAATGEGTLVIFVSFLAGAYPLSGATVSVYNEEGPEKFKKTVLRTNVNGKTPPLRLPSPHLTAQQLYDCSVRPYSVYAVSVEYPRFYTNIHKDVQVFENIETIVNSNMMPLPAEIGQGVTTKVYIVPPTRCSAAAQPPQEDGAHPESRKNGGGGK